MGQIKVEKNAGGIQGLCVIEPTVHGDARGYFMETYNQKDMEEAGLTMQFVQDNQSCSTKGVLRGLHFQKEFPQGKLVRVVKGSVFDVAVDLRIGSKTYGKWYGLELTEENKKQFLIKLLIKLKKYDLIYSKEKSFTKGCSLPRTLGKPSSNKINIVDKKKMKMPLKAVAIHFNIPVAYPDNFGKMLLPML